ncbi:15360_t:CDS:2, partial [Entrophospora sp. SA101]
MQTLSDFLYEYGLELKPHLTKNRILKVLQPLPKGFTLIPSFPLACFPNNNEVSKIRCDQCLGIKPLKTCSKCHKIFYCSSECQTLSWKYHHKKLCSIYANVEQGTNVDDDNDEKMEKEMLRRVSLIISNYLENLKKKDFSKVKTIDERTLINNILCETFLSLMTHRDEQPQTKLENYRKTASKTNKPITNFQFKVYDLCSQIPKANSISSSPRAVGGALKNNPFAPLPIPCHRVIASNFFIGGFN